MSRRASISVLLLCLLGGLAGAQEPALFESKRITPKDSFTSQIEGPAVDMAGNLFVTNLKPEKIGMESKISMLAPGATNPVPYAPLLPGSRASGIRFDHQGQMYVADYRGHKILVYAPGSRIPEVHFPCNACKQPNDLAIAPDATLYASDPKGSSGRIWRITREPNGKVRGVIMTSRRMGKTNGLDVSVDGKTLYVGEANTSELWAYEIDGDNLKNARLVRRLAGSDIDGLRLDIDGRIFVTRNGARSVAIIAPDGKLVREVVTRGANPSNLTFGGPDGKTVFVTQVDGGFIEAFQTNRPGREFCLQHPGPDCRRK